MLLAQRDFLVVAVVQLTLMVELDLVALVAAVLPGLELMEMQELMEQVVVAAAATVAITVEVEVVDMAYVLFDIWQHRQLNKWHTPVRFTLDGFYNMCIHTEEDDCH